MPTGVEHVAAPPAPKTVSVYAVGLVSVSVPWEPFVVVVPML
jgi:hypothetical protein